MSVYITATTDPCESKNISKYIKNLINVGVDYIHFDVMDGKFVDPTKLSPDLIIKEELENPKMQTIIHLMVKNPLEIIDEYICCGAKFLIVHFEAFNSKEDLLKCLNKINKSSTIAGVAINPETSLDLLDKEVLECLGLIMIMGVNPGKSGQKMIDGTLEKIRHASQIGKGKFIACDGGINEENISAVIDAGTDLISLGSLMFKLIKEKRAKEFLAQF